MEIYAIFKSIRRIKCAAFLIRNMIKGIFAFCGSWFASCIPLSNQACRENVGLPKLVGRGVEKCTIKLILI